MSDQASPLDVLNSAFQRSKAHDWKAAQELCAAIGDHAPPIGPIARLNILICQYHLGHTQLIPERALPLLQHLPPSAWLACLGLSLLAARRNGSVADFKHVVLALAEPHNQAFDLPSVPTFVVIQQDMVTCMVMESTDAALMSEVVRTCLNAEGLTNDERAKLQSLAARYRERVSVIAASHLGPRRQNQPNRPWWQFW